MSTEVLILHFLSYCRVSSTRTIGRYMERQWSCSRNSTKVALCRLARAGKVVRVKRGHYTLEAA